MVLVLPGSRQDSGKLEHLVDILYERSWVLFREMNLHRFLINIYRQQQNTVP